MLENRLRLLKYHQEFFSIFKFAIRDYWSNIYGFDVVKFDGKISTPDNVSTYEYVRSKYGEAACKLLDNLIAPMEKV